MPNPEPFLAHLRTEGYHPRSDKHSNALARCVVRDLVEHRQDRVPCFTGHVSVRRDR